MSEIRLNIVFSLFNEAIASAEYRIVGRPAHESASAAIVAWLKEGLPELEVPYTNSLRRMPRIVDTDAELQQDGDAVADLEEISELKSSYLERVLAAGMEAIETLATLESPTLS